jgi:hypothetical protein
MHTAPGSSSSSGQSMTTANRKHRKAKPRRDDLVRLRHPRARPDQLARRSEQTPAVSRIKPIQQRIAKPSAASPAPLLKRRALVDRARNGMSTPSTSTKINGRVAPTTTLEPYP